MGGGASVDGFASPEKFTSRSRGAGGEDEGAGGAEERASSRDEDAPPIRMSRVRLSWRGMPRGGPPKRGRAAPRRDVFVGCVTVCGSRRPMFLSAPDESGAR